MYLSGHHIKLMCYCRSTCHLIPAPIPCFFFLVITMNDAPSSKLPFGNLKYYYKMVTGCIKIILATRTINII